MTKILLFGGTGNLGKQIARVARLQGYAVTQWYEIQRKPTSS